MRLEVIEIGGDEGALGRSAVSGAGLAERLLQLAPRLGDAAGGLAQVGRGARAQRRERLLAVALGQPRRRQPGQERLVGLRRQLAVVGGQERGARKAQPALRIGRGGVGERQHEPGEVPAGGVVERLLESRHRGVRHSVGGRAEHPLRAERANLLGDGEGGRLGGEPELLLRRRTARGTMAGRAGLRVQLRASGDVRRAISSRTARASGATSAGGAFASMRARSASRRPARSAPSAGASSRSSCAASATKCCCSANSSGERTSPEGDTARP